MMIDYVSFGLVLFDYSTSKKVRIVGSVPSSDIILRNLDGLVWQWYW
jgi:hypothetical protein